MIKFKIIVLFLLLTASSTIQAQETFIVDKDTLQLKHEVKGPLSLYWSVQEVNTRYFVQKNNTLIELKDKGNENEQPKIFQQQLAKITADAQIPTDNVNFTLYSLKDFVNRYNAIVKKDYRYNAATTNIMLRLGIFMGISNNKYTYNPKNIPAPVIGLELEFYDPHAAPRHSAFLHFRQSFEQDEYQTTATQFSLNYRFKFLYFQNFNFHIDTELATFSYSREQRNIIGPNGNIIGIERDSGFSFTTPLSFGIGTDIKLTQGNFITFSYNDVVSIFLDGNGAFPIDFTIGYKYNL